MLTTFIRQEARTTIADARADLAALMTDVDNDAAVTALLDRFYSYSPRLHGESSFQWLQHIQARLDQASSTAAQYSNQDDER